MTNDNSSSSNTSTLVSNIAGIGLFLTTTLLSQWFLESVVQKGRRRRREDYDESDDNENGFIDGDDMEELRRLYASRRLHDRLSYEDLSKIVTTGSQKSGQQQQQHNDNVLTSTQSTSADRHLEQHRFVNEHDRSEAANLLSQVQVPHQQHQQQQESHGAMGSSPHMLSWSLGFPDHHSAREKTGVDAATDNVRTSTQISIESNRTSSREAATTTTTTATTTKKELTEWQLHVQQRRSTSSSHLNRFHDSSQKQLHFASTTTMTTSVAGTSATKTAANIDSSSSVTTTTDFQHPNAHFDFHPKNRNWRHFEHYNEHDYRHQQHRQKMMNVKDSETDKNSKNKKSKEGQQRPQHVQFSNEQAPIDDGESENDDDDDDDVNVDDGQSISSSSASSEEQFVWMKHTHRKTSFAGVEQEKQQQKQLQQREKQSHIGTVVDTERSTKQDIDVTDKLATTATANPVQNTNWQQKQSSSFSPWATDGGPSSMGMIRPLRVVQRMLSLGSGEDELKRTSNLSSTNSSQPTPTRTNSQSLGAHSRKLRAEYNARIMPEKLIMIRHGQSMGNINEVLYSTTPDNAMPLTDLGWEQARAAGKILKDKILASGETVHFIVSPYVRTVETFHGIVSAWCDPDEDESIATISDRDAKVKAWYEQLMKLGLTWNEDSRLREQDFGNYQNPEVIKNSKEERQRFGAFYYRFPNGESASDVFDRVSTFLDSLWRSFEMNKSQNYVLVTHGIVLRVLLTRYFRYTIDQFNTLANPRNCELVVLGHAGDGKLDMEGRCVLESEEDPETKKQRVSGYKFHKRLRILPRSYIRKVTARISASDES